MARKPHIVIFNPDQWRGDVLGHMGNPAAVTPNLDRIAKEDAVSFRNAFCQNPVCTPSRCSFMTGWYPHTNGHRTMFHMLRPPEPVLLKTLKDNGWFVWWGGKNDLVPAQDGYEAYCDVKYEPRDKPPPKWTQEQVAEMRGGQDSDTFYSFYFGRMEHTPGYDFCYDGDWANVLGAVDFIGNMPEDKPSVIYLPLGFPHPAYEVEEPWYSMIDRSKVPPRAPTPEGWAGKPSLLKGIAERQNLQSWTEDRWTELRAVYYGMCARVDHQFGMVVDALKKAGVYDDTAIFFFSDHGDFTGDYGLVEKSQNTMEDFLTRVPFVVKLPSWYKAKPRVSDALVELIDMPATVEAVTGLTAEHTHFGKSLVDVVAGAKDQHRDAVFCEGGRLYGEHQAMELESTSSQVPSGFYWPRLSLQADDAGPYHTKAAMCRTHEYKYVKRLYEQDELYDMKNDPHEMNNLIDDPSVSDVLAQLKERMLYWYMETCDVVPPDTDLRW